MKHILSIDLITSTLADSSAHQLMHLQVTDEQANACHVFYHAEQETYNVEGKPHELCGVFNSLHLLNIVSGAIFANFTGDMMYLHEPFFTDPDNDEPQTLTVEIDSQLI